MPQLTVEDRLGDPRVWHSGNVPCPASLRLAHDGDDAWGSCSLQNFSVWDHVLPANVENTAEAAEMKLLHQLFVSPVDGPGLTSVEQRG